MNNAKMWLVVKPTVGIPLFLSGVAIGSFAVHVAVLSNTTWVSDFLSGRPLGASAASAALVEDGAAKAAAYGTTAQQGATAQEVTVILQDGTRARAVIEVPATRIAADAGAPLAITH